MKISVRISLALAMIALIALIASGVAITFLNDFHRNYHAISHQKVPAVIAAAQLTRLTQRLIADAPAIVLAENQIIRQDIMRELEANKQQKDDLLATLSALGTEAANVNAISHSFDLLIDNLDRLNQIASELIVIKTGIHRVQLRLFQLTEQLETEASAAPQSVSRLHRAIDALLNLQLESNIEQLQHLEQQFTTQHSHAENLHPPSEFDEIRREIEYFSTGARNLFASRIRQISLETEIQVTFNQNRFISAELGTKVNHLFEMVSVKVNRQQEQVDRQISQLLFIVFGIPLMVLIGTIAIRGHIRRSVIDRILALERCMHSHIEGTPQPVPVSGHDEISLMAEAVAYFVANRQEYEASLQHTKNIADAANRAKSEFLANMSHELRTPLNAILGFSHLLGSCPNLTSEEQSKLAVIHRSGEHLLSLINDVLDLSKIEAGRSTLHESSFNLYHLLDDVEDMLGMWAQNKNLRLLVERAPDVPEYIRTDEVKLRQVLINLLNNAMKFTKEGGVILRVGTDVETHGRASLRFEISDTGPGIAADEMAHLFDPFVQAASGRQSKEGTGLGLPISLKFAQLMGGDLTVASEAGRGASFLFEIPVHSSDISEVPRPRRARRVLALEPGQCAVDGELLEEHPYRILIVDDHADNRKLLMELLWATGSLRSGFDLREAANGEEALALWQEWRPHLIWMDMRMPIMDGYEAARKIRMAEAVENSTSHTPHTNSHYCADSECIRGGAINGPGGRLR